MSLSEIVNVDITREYVPVSQVGFGTLMILGTHKVFNHRIRYYTSIAGLTADGFLPTDLEYLSAQAAFNQDPRPPQLAIGRRDADVSTITVDTAIDNTDYTCTINNTPFTINSGVAATVDSIAALLVAAILGGAEPVTPSDLTGGAYDVTADVSGTPFTLSVDSNQTADNSVPTDTIVNDITAVQESSNDWYAVTETLHDPAEVILLAAWIETNNKLYGTSSHQNAIVNETVLEDTTSIPALFKVAGYARSFSVYHHSNVIDEFIECAWFGKMLSTDPGSATWALKSLTGITPDTLNVNQSNNARDKYSNTYELIAQVGVTRDGKVADNEYIDLVRGTDWLVNLIQLALFTALTTSPKIPYTNQGIAIVENVLRASLSRGIQVGFLTSDPVPYISVPDISDISAADKQARILNDVEFQATPAGAMQQITINGRLGYQI